MTDPITVGVDSKALWADGEEGLQESLQQSWNLAWSFIGRPAPAGLQAESIAAWSESHRHYHDLRHLHECLAIWACWRGLCVRPGEVAIALWFHDAVYDTQATPAGSNELASAAWAARSLVRAGADSDTAQRVHDLVMATQHDAPVKTTSNPDAELLVDIDLAILGSPAERFERYDQDVRKEYAWVPAGRYQQGRALVLQSFLNRPRLYQSEPAFVLLEAQARLNLKAALSRLLL